MFVTFGSSTAKAPSILYSSQKLDEVKRLCDTATIVLRRGSRRYWGSRSAPEETRGIASIGDGGGRHSRRGGGRAALRSFDDCAATTSFDRAHTSARAMTRTAPSVRPHLRCERGEIFGIAGAAGNGQPHLLVRRSAANAPAPRPAIRRRLCRRASDPDRRRRGMALRAGGAVRPRRGPVEGLPENALLTGHRPRLGASRPRSARLRRSSPPTAPSDLRRQGDWSAARRASLSGGNLQNFIVGREILQRRACSWSRSQTGRPRRRRRDRSASAGRPQPRRGRRADRVGVLDQLFEICDRLLVICNGSVSRSRGAAAAPTARKSGCWMSGLLQQPPPPGSRIERRRPRVLPFRIEQRPEPSPR